MRKFELLAATAALAVAAPLMAQVRVREYAFVPTGMMPPAGMCRVWINGVPPGRQPAPTSCAAAARWLPANARIVYGPGVYDNGLYRDQIIREREIQIAREQELQIARDRELQIARERELQIARDREWQIARDRDLAAVRAREAEAARIRTDESRAHENHDGAWNHRNDDHRNDNHRDNRPGDRR